MAGAAMDLVAGAVSVTAGCDTETAVVQSDTMTAAVTGVADPFEAMALAAMQQPHGKSIASDQNDNLTAETFGSVISVGSVAASVENSFETE